VLPRPASVLRRSRPKDALAGVWRATCGLSAALVATPGY